MQERINDRWRRGRKKARKFHFYSGKEEKKDSQER